ncbi:hypothetical protein [Kiloniella spongiae]|uniref:hypothetical protein n=1 Tax=Kiloniella spongiae TaxID=1489064 RepID=UPI000699B1E1|nr:hypothetical protein [Kiloniella spongiae]
MLDQLYSQQITSKGQTRPAIHNGSNSTDLDSNKVALTKTAITPESSQKENNTRIKTPSAAKPAQKSQFGNELSKTNSASTNLREPTDWSVKEKTPEQPSPEQKEQTFGFFDFLDVINPLQHIPVISTLYREITGDEIQPAARVAGGMIFGGPTGFITAIANSVSKETTGKDIGENILEAFLGSDEDDQSPIQTAALEVSSEKATPPLFSQLSPIIPPAPVQQPKFENAVASNTPGSASPLEGKAALAALYNDLAKPAATESVSQETKASNASLNVQQGSPAPLPVSRPGKWFPLSGSNVLIAQTSNIPPTTSPKPATSTVTTSAPNNTPSAEETIASIESDFAQNLLNGLDKYQQLKTNN